MMSYFSTTIASYFIEKSNKEGSPLSVLQLIKLTYIAHGWCLALNDAPLISDRIEAWKYGPVMPVLHFSFAQRGLKKDDLVQVMPSSNESNSILPRHVELLNKVYAKYKYRTGRSLTTLLHKKDAPWFNVWANGAGRDQLISDEATKAYYGSQITRELFDSLSEYAPIRTKEEATILLKRAGILLPNGELDPFYRND